MDDNELGALLDTTVPAAAPSDATLTRIQSRAAQRVRRARFATAALVAVLIATGGATAAALAGTSNGARPVTPAETSAPPLAVGVPGGLCPTGSLTLAFDQGLHESGSGPGYTSTSWLVLATANTDLICRWHGGLDAVIATPDGTVVGGIPGNPADQVEFGDGQQDLFRPGHGVYVATLTWKNPCSTGPVQLVVRFLDGSFGQPARLNLPRQQCPTTRRASHFDIGLGALDSSNGPLPSGSTTTAATP